MKEEQSVLELKNVTFSYEEKKVLSQVSFSVKKNEVGCLLGESGSGKTSVLRLIAGLEEEFEGEVFLRGKKMIKKPPHQRRLGFVFQEANLFPHLNVLENLTLSKKPLDEVIEILDLKELFHKYPHEISGGEAQKVALARSLNSDFDILLLDEPLSHIDSHNRKDIIVKLKEFFYSEKKTVLFVTHSEQEAFELADTIGVMKDGQLLQWDTPTQLYHSPEHIFVAQLLGKGFFLENFKENKCVLGSFEAVKKKGFVSKPQIFIRPEQLVLGEGENFQVHQSQFLGQVYGLVLETREKEKVMVFSSKSYDTGSFVKVSFKPHQRVTLFSP